MNWSNFITRLCFLLKLFIKMCFMFHTYDIWWHHDIWISEKLKLDYLKNEKSSQCKTKNIFLVSKVHPFRHTKQTSENVANTPLERAKNCFIPWKPTKALAQTQNYNYNCFTIAFSLIKLDLIPQNRHLLNCLIKCLTGVF